MVKDASTRSSVGSRTIPRSTMVDIIHSPSNEGALSVADLTAVAKLSRELTQLGLIQGTVDSMRGIGSEAELASVLSDAEARSQAEEELSPEYHSAKLDAELMEREGISNPLMEKFDEYEGVDYNPAFRAQERLENLRRDSPKRRRAL